MLPHSLPQQTRRKRPLVYPASYRAPLSFHAESRPCNPGSCAACRIRRPHRRRTGRRAAPPPRPATPAETRSSKRQAEREPGWRLDDDICIDQGV